MPRIVTIEYLMKQALDVIGRYSHLTPIDIKRVWNIGPDTLRKDAKKGLIEAMGKSGVGVTPEYDIHEIYSYLVKKGKFLNPALIPDRYK